MAHIRISSWSLIVSAHRLLHEANASLTRCKLGVIIWVLACYFHYCKACWFIAQVWSIFPDTWATRGRLELKAAVLRVQVIY